MGSNCRKFLAFFCRERPEETQKATSAKNGIGSNRVKVAEVNFVLRIASTSRLISAARSCFGTGGHADQSGPEGKHWRNDTCGGNQVADLERSR